MADQENEKIDISKILLPKKEGGPSINSAARVNAGALLEQEQGAALPKPPAPTAPPPKPPEEERVVKAVETYRGAIEELVQKKNVSVVSIAAAEALRRGEAGGGEAGVGDTDDAASTFLQTLGRVALVAAGVLLLAGAAGAVLWVLQPAPAVVVQAPENAPFIHTDSTVVFTVPPTAPAGAAAIAALEEKRKAVSLSLGLVAWFYLAEQSVASDGAPALSPLSTARALQLMAPNVPGTLLRALDQDEYLLAVHSFDGNQPLLILKAESYEQAFAGMLEWERSMAAELAPLFTRTPPERIVEDVVEDALATTTATTTDSVATSTPPSAPAATTPAGFTDEIVENQNARVIKNEYGDIVLLWSFINRSTVVVTTNDATLREVISRLRSSPIVPTP